jgi:nucleotide sugar dehydrogenase
MKITVVGLGKIGLPLAVQYAKKGHTVFGADINEHTVELVNSAIEPFPGEHLLQEYLTEVSEAGFLTATTNTSEAVAQSEVVVVAVPLFVDHDAVPDFRAMDKATEAIGKGLARGTLVSFETTLPVGTTRDRLAPMLEKHSSLSAEQDFFVVFSPERVFTGRVFADLRKYPKLIGGIGQASTTKAKAFYEAVLDFDPRHDLKHPNGVWNLGAAEAAELAKLAETTYRDVNIGLANQFAKYADEIDVDIYKVIEACNSQPFSQIHQPGIAVGGHCIPVYPRLYLWNDPKATIVQAAREANATMPAFAIDRLEKEMGSLTGKTILILGASYRPGVKETAFSGVFPLVELLLNKGALPLIHDPLYSAAELEELRLPPWTEGSQVDAAIIQTGHEQYLQDDFRAKFGSVTLIDGRNLLGKGFLAFAR